MEQKEFITRYLNAIYQNTKTALQSIEDILPKTDNKELKNELAREQDAYFCIAKECELFAKSENVENIKDNNFIEKAKLWTSINMSTLMNSTTRHITELMLLGTFMGIVTCIKVMVNLLLWRLIQPLRRKLWRRIFGSRPVIR